MKTGTSQGGVGSPTWFNYGMDELLDELKRAAEEAGFADDLQVAVKGHTKWACHKGAQKAIDITVPWAERNGLEFSPSKTHAMFLTRKIGENAIPPAPLRMYGQEIKYVDSTDYLGIKIDSNLTWNAHLNNKRAKAKRCMIMCGNALEKIYGPKPVYMRWLFLSVIRPQLTYGCYVWAQATETKTNREKLKKFERMGLKMITYVRKSTPTDALRIMYNITPLHLYIREMAMNTYYRVRKYNWIPKI